MLCVRGARALRYNIWVYIGDPSLATIAAGQQSFCYWSLPVGGFAPRLCWPVHTDYSSAGRRPSASANCRLGSRALPSIESIAHPVIEGLSPI